MTVLITGGAGYIGSHVALCLLDHDEEAIVLDDLSTGCKHLVPPRARFVRGDIADRELVTRTIQDHCIRAVIHLAARTIVPDSVAHPAEYYRINVAKTQTLLETVASAGVPHVIFSSSAAVYGNPAASPVPETAALQPISPYGRSKLMVEWMLEDMTRSDEMTAVALRYFNVAGADPLGRSGQVSAAGNQIVKTAVQAACGMRDGIDLYGDDYSTPDGTCIRDYVHVSDVAAAHLAVLRYMRRGGGGAVFNIGSGHGTSVWGIIEAVKRLSGCNFPVRIGPRRPGDPAAVVADTAAMRMMLRWRPAYDSLNEIVGDALSWERRLTDSHFGEMERVSAN